MHSRGFYVQTENEKTMDVFMVTSEGKETQMLGIDPSLDLISVLDYNYGSYRDAVERLREYPLITKQRNVHMDIYQRFMEEACRLPPMLARFDKVGYYFVTEILKNIAAIPDDNSASFPVDQCSRVMHALLMPVHSQLRLRNIFEAVFGQMERATQAERSHAIQQYYAKDFDIYFRVKQLPVEKEDEVFGSRVEYCIDSLMQFRMLELRMHLRQKRRFARCANCWNYFLPKTQKETLYCDRVFNGKTCKQAGPLGQRRVEQHEDNALAIYEELRHRMAARYERYNDSGERMRTDYPMDFFAYCKWGDEARAARQAYLEGSLTPMEFIVSIDCFKEYEDFVSERTEKKGGPSLYAQRARSNINFDPADLYVNRMTLDLSAEEPAWSIQSAAGWQKEEMGDQRSIRDKLKDIDEG